jgi:hypothetical protein
MTTEYTIRTTDRAGKKSFITYRSKEVAIETFTRCNDFHTKKNDGILVELFKVVRYGSSVHHIEKV